MELRNLINKYGADHPIIKDGWFKFMPLVENREDPEKDREIWENGLADVKRIIGQEEES